MQLLAYLLVYPLLWLISILPFRLMYMLSDAIYLLVYYLIGYRKKVVRNNLALSFPEKSAAERLVIEKKFYRHMCDMFLEMIKTMNISEREIRKRFVFTNMDEYLTLEKKGKSIIMMAAHYASYEWVISMNYYITFEGFAIYKRVANKYFDRLVHKIRSRFQAHLVTTKKTIDTITTNQANGRLGVYGFAGDQSPKANKVYHWGIFMGHPTAMITGGEMLAKRFDMNMIYLNVEKVKRGYYQATFVPLSENVREVPDYQITDRFMSLVEAQVKKAPEYYLWTHKRWKAKVRAAKDQTNLK
jgi:KDO2-lipid IV(A) lauroyltransferase